MRFVAALLFAVVSITATPVVAGDGAAIAAAALAQVGVTRHYDPAYVRLGYPGGDVPPDRGVCTDAVVRAFRGIGVDLQVAVHDDMLRNFSVYPQLWGLRSPDRNIDHRRVPNLMTYLQRRGKAVPREAAYEPGDVVAWRLPGGRLHIGIVSAVRNGRDSDYLLVHNIGYGTHNEDVLREFQIIGHYRW
jgi:uncharacterized protein